MADPKEGYNSGVNRAVNGSIGGDGDFNPAASGDAMTPSTYAAAPVTLITAGVSLGQMATGATTLSIGITAAATTPVVVGFGTTSVDALANVDATAGAELGHMLEVGAVGTADKVGIPTSLGSNPFAAVACLTATTAKAMASQGS